MTTAIKKGSYLALVAGAVFLAASGTVSAADHRDSLAVDALPEGDFTDVFAYVDPANENNVVLAMMVNPFTNPAEGPSVRFASDYLYQMKINNNNDNGPTEDLVL